MRAYLMALLALVSAPAVPQTTASAPVDTVARAKFPKETPEMVDALSALNKLVNDGIQGESDQEHYGVQDFWVMMPADGKGDCEDYALTKIFLLQQAGFPIVSNTKLVGLIVHERNGAIEGHAILAVLLPKGDVAYLDNMNTEPMTRKELVAQGYQFFDWKA